MSSLPVIPAACGQEWVVRAGSDGRSVRQTICALSGASARGGPLRFYPRSFAYKVDPDGAGTFVHLYGSTPTGDTVAVQATGFQPYMFLRVPPDTSDAAVARLVAQLDSILFILALQEPNGPIGWHVRAACKQHGRRPVVGHARTACVPLKTTGADRGYHGGRTADFVQVFLYSPKLVPVVRTLLETASALHPFSGSVYEWLPALFAAVRRSRDRKREVPAEAAPEQRSLRTLAAVFGDLSIAGPWNDPAVDVGEAEQPGAGSDAEEAPAFTVGGSLLGDDVRAVREAGCAAALFLNDRVPDAYEADIDFVIRFCIDAGIVPECCVECTASTVQRRAFKIFRADDVTVKSVWEFSCDWRHVVPATSAADAIPPQVCMSFDCEMALGPDGAFPKPETEPVLQICCAVYDPVRDRACDHVVRRAFVLGADVACPARWHPDEIFVCASERDLLQCWNRWTRYLQPDIVTGWNIENFDLFYLLERAKTLAVPRFASLCRLPGADIYAVEREFTSRAHGTHFYKEVKGEGFFVWDMFQAFKRSTSYKFRSYSLEFVSNTILGDRKEDVAYSAINGLQQTTEGRARLMEYCMKDAVLPARLMGHEMLMIEGIELARITGVPMDMICRRGLQVRLKSLLYREAKAEQPRCVFYTRTEADRRAYAGTYPGAYVHPPVLGYHDVPVATLDFAALYPSIMRTKNTCVLSLVPGRAVADRCAEHALSAEADLWLAERNALPGDFIDQPAFVRCSRQPGLVPRILQRLLDMRKRVKGEMKRAPNDILRAILDKRQLAIKLNCNSIYGVFGAGTSFAYCPEIAATVTATGRDMILETKRVVEERYTRANGYPYDAQIVYGDSVVGDTPLVLKKAADGPVYVQRFDELWAEYEKCAVTVQGDGDSVKYVVHHNAAAADQCLPLVYSETGFTQMQRVIRHRCQKSIMRILTHTGIVDATTDHSLVMADGSISSPSRVTKGSELLHAPVVGENNFVVNDEITLEMAFVMGLFLADGTAGVWNSPSGKKASWKIVKSNRQLLEQAAAKCPFQTKIYDAIQSSGVYILCTFGIPVIALARQWRAMFYNSVAEKKVPSRVINATVPVIREFMRGFYCGDGDKDQSY